MTTSRRRALIAFATGSFALAGCTQLEGGVDDDEEIHDDEFAAVADHVDQTPREFIEALYAAISEGDDEAILEQLHPEYIAEENMDEQEFHGGIEYQNISVEVDAVDPEEERVAVVMTADVTHPEREDRDVEVGHALVIEDGAFLLRELEQLEEDPVVE